MSVPVTTAELEGLLKAVGNDIIRAYRDKYFPARIVQACPNAYSVENAASWVKPDKFCAFVAHALQEQSPPPTPSTPGNTDVGSDNEVTPRKRIRASAPLHSATEGVVSVYPPCMTSSSFNHESVESGESDRGDNGTSPSPALAPGKRKRGEEKPRGPRSSAKLAAGLVRVTRQCWVNHVETTTEAPQNWPVPEAGHSVAYVLDLTNDPHHYADAKGDALAMSAIIKHKCTDGWAGGSGGSVSKATTVPILGEEVKCQKMSHECRGAFVCSMAAPDLWKGYQRSDRDVEPPSAVWPPPITPDEAANHLRIEQALRFYNIIVKDKCHFDNGRCLGRPTLRALDQISVEGKYHYICCSAWMPGNMEHSHFSREIPGQIDETVVRQLFETRRNNFSNTVVSGIPCTFQVPPRTGLKQKQCPHIHFHGDRIVEGIIQHRPCPAKITIFSPVDHTVRKAAIIPATGVPHNHPPHPSDKITRRAKAALRAAGIADTTPGIVGPPQPTTPTVIDDECVNGHMGGTGPSNSLPPLGSSIMLPTVYNMEQFY